MAGNIMLAWDDGLAGPAKRIAEIDHSPFRVLAGPGTGKTFALKRRVARLLQTGHDASRLFVCTFTRTAASDLKNEVVGLGVEGVEAVRACTLHSYCFELLAKASVLELTGRVPRPLLSFEERFLLQDMCGDPLGGIRDCDKRLKAFNAAWARLQNEEPGWCSDPADKAFDYRLKSWLRFHQAMLIGELIPESLRYLRDNPLCEERQQFDHVLVDEYQDLNRAEQVLLDNVADGHNLQVIGDEDQSVYSFKHAHPEGVSEFGTTHPNTHDETLEICRRCPTSVVEMANCLISHNILRKDRTLRPHEGNPEGEVHVIQWASMDDEAEGVATYIKEKIVEDNVAPGRVLVLSPRRQFGYAVRNALNAISTPAHSFFNEEAVEGNVKKLDESQAAQAFTLLTLLANSDDRVALRCWCGFGSNSLNKGAWEKLRAYSCETGTAPRAILEALAAGQLSIPHTKPIVARYQELKLRLQTLQGLRGVPLLAELFPAATEWSEPLRTLALRCQRRNLMPPFCWTRCEQESPSRKCRPTWITCG